jgi:hypothetical protein
VSNIDDAMRERWEAYRAKLRMTDNHLDSPDFADGGLSLHVQDPTVRILVLPADPDWPNLSFTDDVAALISPQILTPSGSELASFTRDVATSTALLKVVATAEVGEKPWASYAGIHHNGAVEMEMGGEGAYSRIDPERDHRATWFYLAPIIRWTWTALDVRRRLVDIGTRVSNGPVEVTVALRDLAGAALASLGEGWQEPYDTMGRRIPQATEPNALLRYELDDVTDVNAIKAAALEIGDRIDNCFGIHQHRHLNTIGDQVGQFTPGR